MLAPSFGSSVVLGLFWALDSSSVKMDITIPCVYGGPWPIGGVQDMLVFSFPSWERVASALSCPTGSCRKDTREPGVQSDLGDDM